MPCFDVTEFTICVPVASETSLSLSGFSACLQMLFPLAHQICTQSGHHGWMLRTIGSGESKRHESGTPQLLPPGRSPSAWLAEFNGSEAQGAESWAHLLVWKTKCKQCLGTQAPVERALCFLMSLLVCDLPCYALASLVPRTQPLLLL